LYDVFLYGLDPEERERKKKEEKDLIKYLGQNKGIYDTLKSVLKTTEELHDFIDFNEDKLKKNPELLKDLARLLKIDPRAAKLIKMETRGETGTIRFTLPEEIGFEWHKEVKNKSKIVNPNKDMSFLDNLDYVAAVRQATTSLGIKNAEISCVSSENNEGEIVIKNVKFIDYPKYKSLFTDNDIKFTVS
jgi:hypothetical protein